LDVLLAKMLISLHHTEAKHKISRQMPN